MVEVLVVLAIALTVTAIAIPQITSTLRRYSIDQAQIAVSAAIQTSRARAMSSGLPVRLTFTSANRTYSVDTIVSDGSCDPSTSVCAYSVPVSASIPFTGTSGLTLASDTILYMRPSGLVLATDGTTVPCSLTTKVKTLQLTYKTLNRTIDVGCYGKLTVSQ